MSSSEKKEATVNEIVDEMLKGLQATYPGAIKVHVDCKKLLVRTFQKSGCVSIVSGGRTGNEPFPSGFVGTGMLSAALYGENLNPPTADEISKLIRIIAGDTIGTDILLIAPTNPTNRENFTLGAEKARNQTTKIKVSSVLVGEEHKEQNSDTCSSSLEDILTTILICKIAGAMAMEGKPLEVIISTLEDIISLQTTFEVNVTSISLSERPLFESNPKSEHDIKDDDMDYLTDEIQDMKKEFSLNDDILKKLNKICSSSSIKQEIEVAVLVNNSDSTLQMIQWIFLRRLEKELCKNEIKVVRFYSGNIISAHVQGKFQVCILKLGRNDKEKNEWLNWLDAPTSAPAWPGGAQSINIHDPSLQFENYITTKNSQLVKENHSLKYKSTFNNHEAEIMYACIKSATLALINAEDKLNALQRENKEFKHGTIMKVIANAILENLDNLPTRCPADLLSHIAIICESQKDYDLGLVFAIFFTAAIPPLIYVEEKLNNLQWAEVWGKAFKSGVEGIRRFYCPKEGKKTLVDLLTFASTKYESFPKDDFSGVIEALNSCLLQQNEYETIDGSKKKDINGDSLQNLGYDIEACGAEVCLKAIINEISNHLSNFM